MNEAFIQTNLKINNTCQVKIGIRSAWKGFWKQTTTIEKLTQVFLKSEHIQNLGLRTEMKLNLKVPYIAQEGMRILKSHRIINYQINDYTRFRFHLAL